MRKQQETIAIVCSDLATPIVAANLVGYVIVPWDFWLLDVQGSFRTPTTSGTFTVDVNSGGTTVFSTKLTFGAGEVSSLNNTPPPVLIDGQKMIYVPKGRRMTVDIDDDASGDAVGLIVYLLGFRGL